jgi:hypothetical protein
MGTFFFYFFLEEEILALRFFSSRRGFFLTRAPLRPSVPRRRRWLDAVTVPFGDFGPHGDDDADDGGFGDALVPGSRGSSDVYASAPPGGSERDGGGFFVAPQLAPGSPSQASHHRAPRGVPERARARMLRHERGSSEAGAAGDGSGDWRRLEDPTAPPVTFSFEPEDDPVVCGMVSAAQEQARARALEAQAQHLSAVDPEKRNEAPRVASSDPAAASRLKAADLERRLAAKRKYAELCSVVERLAVKAEIHGKARDALNAASERATAEARDAERRRNRASAASTSSGGRRGGAGGALHASAAATSGVPFDLSAFVSLQQKREREILNKQGLTSLKQLMNHKWAFPFNAPVDHVALGLTTYTAVVKCPMDLGTVRRRLEGSTDALGGGDSNRAPYATCEELHRDVRLTFANAKLYNPPATDVHVMATALEAFWAPRGEALLRRSSDVRESLEAERECAVKNSEAIKTRRALANEEMRCAGIAADLDAARRSLEDLKRRAARSARPLDADESRRLTVSVRGLPVGYRGVARDLVAETEGAHRVPVDGVAHWNEVLEDLFSFGAVAHRRLARFVKVRRRNRLAMAGGWCNPDPTEGFDAGRGERFAFEDAREEGGAGEEKPRDEPFAAEAAAAAAAAAAGGGSGASGGEDSLMALALGGGNWQGGATAARSEPELVRLVSGG